MKPFSVLSPTAILGYGFPDASFERGMAADPDLIAVDAGSSDPGPYYLGSGHCFTDAVAVKHDLRRILRAGLAGKIPVVIGTAGGSGALPHLQRDLRLIEEIAAEESLSFKLGVISADIAAEDVAAAYKEGRIVPVPGGPELSNEVISNCSHIVAQMDESPMMEALDAGCEIVLAGRAYDPACFAALPIMRGYDRALALHLGKILECAAIAAQPGSGADCAMGILYANAFELQALNRERNFTATSTAAHSLYEKTDPYFLYGPGGRLNLTGCTFTELDGGRVRVAGSVFEPTEDLYVKLEGAGPAGFRTLAVAGIRDPILIDQIDEVLSAVERQVQNNMKSASEDARVFYHVYGRNGVMASREPYSGNVCHEVAVLIEALAPTQAEADTLCSLTRSTLLHYGYHGRISTAGNLALPFSPSDIRMGPAFEFGIYHLMRVTKPLFPVQVIDITGQKSTFTAQPESRTS